jgi:sugar phosphate isomerase/epimerase
VLDLDAFLRDLAGSGYDGTVSLEVDLRKRLDDPAGLRSLLIEMREQVESLLAVA